MSTTISSIPSELESALRDVAQKVRMSSDQWGNGFYWVKLSLADKLPSVAALLAPYKARLCTVTAMSQSMDENPIVILEYHFDVGGAVVTVIVPLDPAENRVPTITPWFRNADWNEREASELYDIHVDGNTNPDRLFLDDSIDQGILNEVIPLSIMMNGACTKDLWEHLTAINLPSTDETDTSADVSTQKASEKNS